MPPILPASHAEGRASTAPPSARRGSILSLETGQIKGRCRSVVEDPLEEEMATYSNVPAWRIPWTEKPGESESLGSHRVGHN